MNWLIVGAPLIAFILIWSGYLIAKKKYNKSLLLMAFAHLPYYLMNVVAPFRGPTDSDYGYYVSGLILIPQGPTVTLVSGTILISCFFIITRSLQNRMENMWLFTFVFDAVLAAYITLPEFIDLFENIEGSKIQLGEYLTIPGLATALIIVLLFTFPTCYSIYYSAKNLLKK
ncbi:hypothetical protein [Ekhidna sp.]|uniref:hypothetical protein n=1 Tax=Ekhidna sp. TaxID=2608089 RepID=UPI0032EFB414